MNNGWIDRRLSSIKVLSPFFSCGMAVVLMQGNMHWRWAKGPPTQSVCLSAAWRISLFLFQTGHWQSHSIHFSVFQTFSSCFFFHNLSNKHKSKECWPSLLIASALLSSSNYRSAFSSVITSVRLLPDLGIVILGLYWPWPPVSLPSNTLRSLNKGSISQSTAISLVYCFVRLRLVLNTLWKLNLL